MCPSFHAFQKIVVTTFYVFFQFLRNRTNKKKLKTRKQRLKRQIKYDAKYKRDRRAHGDLTSPSMGERRRKKISYGA
jgi:hypothetical protein